MTYVVVGIIAYLLGSFPTGVVLSRRKYGIDVREMGSGNIGATNITRVFGWYAGLLTFVIDCLKGLLPLLFLRQVFPDAPWLITVAGAGLVLGHCFSLYLKGGGGKGVATSLGVILAVAPWAALSSGLVYLILLVTTRISAVGSLVGVLVALIYVAVARPPEPSAVLIALISVIVVARHRSNILRLWEESRARRK